MKKCLSSFVLLFLFHTSYPATIHVPYDNPTIQTAIHSASAGDTILVARGMFHECLNIDISLHIIGAGSNSTIVYKKMDDEPVISVENANVTLSGIEIIGADYNPLYFEFIGNSKSGLKAENSIITLEDIAINYVVKRMITVEGGSLGAKRVNLSSRPRQARCEVGFELIGCTAQIQQLKQESGRIEQTIRINSGSVISTADVKVTDAAIRAAQSTPGDGIRVYSDVMLQVRDCRFYRSSDGQPPDQNNTGINISGDHVTAAIIDNTFESMACGILYSGGDSDSNRVIVEKNRFVKCVCSGVRIADTNFAGIDLGGGIFGGNGENRFENVIDFDVLLQNTNANIYAKYNWWSNINYPDSVIWDRKDSPWLGRVIFAAWPKEPVLQTPYDGAEDVSINPLLIWQQPGGANTYNIQVASDPLFKNLILWKEKLFSNQFRLGSLEYHVRYYWRISAKNAFGESEFCKPFSFVTTFPIPYKPTLDSPLNSATNQPPILTLSWDEIKYAACYHVQVSERPDFTYIVVEDTCVQKNSLKVTLKYDKKYYWRVRAYNLKGISVWSNVFTFSTLQKVGVAAEENQIPLEYKLAHPFPNPFNARTTIEFSQPTLEHVELAIYDIRGRKREMLVSKMLAAGEYRIVWNADRYASGSYFCRMRVGNFVDIKKLVLIR